MKIIDASFITDQQTMFLDRINRIEVERHLTNDIAENVRLT